MMKRNTVFLFFSLVFTGIGIQAQNTFRPEWVIGVSGGIDFSSVSFSRKVAQNKLMGVNGGVTVRWITEKNLGLQLEVNFSQKGWKEDIEQMDEEKTLSMSNPFYSRTLNYIDIPLLTHIYLGGNKIRFFVNMGPQIGFFLYENRSENLNGESIPNKPNAQHTLQIEKKIEWGLGGGPGLEFRSNAGYFLLEGRYYYGLSDIYSTRRGDAFSKASNQIIAVKLSYLIPIRK